MAIYEKPVRFLMWDMVNDISLKKGDRISKDRVVSWFREKYPRIKLGTVTAHLIRMSVNANSRHHYNPKPIEDDLFYQIDGGSFRLYDNQNDSNPIQNDALNREGIVPEEEENPEDRAEFAYEKGLAKFSIPEPFNS